MANPWDVQVGASTATSSNSMMPGNFESTYQDDEGSIDEAELKLDKDFIEASRIMYRMNEGKDWSGDNAELADYGVNFMGWFNWNIPKMTLDAARITNAGEDQQRAMLYMMESYDDLSISWAGAGRAAKGLLADPTTYIGLTTFGVGAGVAQAGKLATKEGFKGLLKQSVKGGMIAGVESGIYTAVDDVNRQVVETSVSGEDIDLGRTAKMGAIGTAAGFGLGTTITAIGKKLASKTQKAKAEAEALTRQAEMEEVGVGVSVRASDRGNVGKVVDVDEDGIATVRFESEDGATAVKTFDKKDLTSLTPKKILKEDQPVKTVKAYKMFRQDQKTGELYPLFVKMGDNKPIEINKWVKAEAGELNAKTGKVKSSLGDLAYRPGFHAGDLPIATHIGGKVDPKTGLRVKGAGTKPNVREDFHVWAEVEMAADVDWQKVANERAVPLKNGEGVDVRTAHITDQLPVGGHYRYKTNPNMTGNWLIGGEMKVTRVLDDAEVKKINLENGTADLPRMHEVMGTPAPKRIEVPGANLRNDFIAELTPAGKMGESLQDIIKTVKSIMPEAKAGALVDEVETTVTAKVPKGKKGIELVGGKAVKKVGKEITVKSGVRQSMAELKEMIKPISEILSVSAGKNTDEIAEFLAKAELTPTQAQGLHAGAADASSELGQLIARIHKDIANTDDVAVIESLRNQVDELVNEVVIPLHKVVDVFNSNTGRSLRMLQEFDIKSYMLYQTPEEIAKAENISRRAAEAKYNKLWEEAESTVKSKREVANLKAEIQKSFDKGDITEALVQKDRLTRLEGDIEAKEIAKNGSLFRKLYDEVNKPIKVINEIMISFVFSPATLIINTVPSLAKVIYKPFINNLVKGDLNSQSLRRMSAEYGAMMSIIPTALKSAKAAWRYERSMLTGDSARFLENYNTIPKQIGGGVVRFFPRALLATDAFFESVHYRGFTVGNATGAALEDAAEKGLKGKALDDFVTDRVNRSLEIAYKPQETVFDILYAEGKSRGYGSNPTKMENWIKKEIEKRGDTFTEATNKEGRDYVQDVLFKRDFSGNNAASQLAKGYEGFVNRNPVMRIAGQLFFRTPVRVFEEGFRLTAGLNLISPGFMSDLTGKNGQMRQVRAQGEAMLSFAIAGGVFAAYSTGNVTGAKDANYKQRRQGENAGDVEPYSIIFSDGSTFNYRNFDPFSTPIKIIVNALERAEVLAYRTEQGERVDDTEIQNIQAYVSVAVGSIAQSIRDANLASGVDSIFKLVEDLQDEDGSDQLIKFVGQKVQTFYPNTLYKVSMQKNPVLSDPATLEQFIRYRINPTDDKVPKQYTALGEVRELSNPAAALYYFNTASIEERKRGKSKDELKVEQFLYRLGQMTNTHFTAPYTFRAVTGKLDLRTKLTRDGKESLYDRWMRNYRNLRPHESLLGLTDIPVGTPTDKAQSVKVVKEVINSLREAAFYQMYQDELQIQDKHIDLINRNAEALSGERDVTNIPYNILTQGNN